MTPVPQLQPDGSWRLGGGGGGRRRGQPPLSPPQARWQGTPSSVGELGDRGTPSSGLPTPGWLTDGEGLPGPRGLDSLCLTGDPNSGPQPVSCHAARCPAGSLGQPGCGYDTVRAGDTCQLRLSFGKGGGAGCQRLLTTASPRARGRKARSPWRDAEPTSVCLERPWGPGNPPGSRTGKRRSGDGDAWLSALTCPVRSGRRGGKLAAPPRQLRDSQHKQILLLFFFSLSLTGFFPPLLFPSLIFNLIICQNLAVRGQPIGSERGCICLSKPPRTGLPLAANPGLAEPHSPSGKSG